MQGAFENFHHGEIARTGGGLRVGDTIFQHCEQQRAIFDAFVTHLK